MPLDAATLDESFRTTRSQNTWQDKPAGLFRRSPRPAFHNVCPTV
jgi:hypothetical protein